MHLNSVSFLNDTYPTLEKYPFSLDLFKIPKKSPLQHPSPFLSVKTEPASRPCWRLLPTAADFTSGGESNALAMTSILMRKNCTGLYEWNGSTAWCRDPFLRQIFFVILQKIWMNGRPWTRGCSNTSAGNRSCLSPMDNPSCPCSEPGIRSRGFTFWTNQRPLCHPRVRLSFWESCRT